MAARRTNPVASAAAIFAALELLSSGKAKTKKEAAQMAGIQPCALAPQNVALLQLRNPRLSAVTTISALDITAKFSRDGKEHIITMREALAKGATRAAIVIAELSDKLGTLTKDEERSYQQCAKHLTLCRTLGLFTDPEPASIPGELLNQPEPLPAGSVKDWRRKVQQARGEGRMITVQRGGESSTVDSQ